LASRIASNRIRIETINNDNIQGNTRKEGQREGKYKKAVETAITMKKDGLQVSVISKYTRLSEKEIGKL
jgi:hypothetical protein